MAETYYDLLRRPEWQRKRLVIMERAGFRCEHCDADTKTLNVHHRLYRKGAKPWEYIDDELECLCEDCHEEQHKLQTEIKELMAALDSLGWPLEQLLGYLKGQWMLYWSDIPSCDPHETLGSHEAALGIADAYRITGRGAADKIIVALTADGFVAHSKLTQLQDSPNCRPTVTGEAG